MPAEPRAPRTGLTKKQQHLLKALARLCKYHRCNMAASGDVLVIDGLRIVQVTFADGWKLEDPIELKEQAEGELPEGWKL